MSSSASRTAHAAISALQAWAAARFGRGAAAACNADCAVAAAAAGGGHAGPFGQCRMQKPHNSPGRPALQIFLPNVHGTASPSVWFFKVHLSGRPGQEQFRLPYLGCMLAAGRRPATVNATVNDKLSEA